VFSEAIFVSDRQRIVDFAAKHRLPAIYRQQSFIEIGGLMVYGANFLDLARRAGSYVDKILRGANPGDLPIEQPTAFELVVNLRTAKALGDDPTDVAGAGR
jgi:putative ABC transport system substrate-binding protein